MMEVEGGRKRQKLNIEGGNKSLWLVKVPVFVAQKWSYTENVDENGHKIKRENGDNLGSMRIVGKDSDKKTIITLEDGFELTLEDLGSNPNMLVFNNDEDGGYSVSGKITKNMALTPKDTPQYRALLRNRAVKATERVTVTAVDESINSTLAENSTMEFVPPIYTENKRKSQELKQSRKAQNISAPADKTMLTNCILSAFSSSEKMVFKELVATVQKSHPKIFDIYTEKELKDELTKYATYSAGGVFKHHWQLKADYRDHTGGSGK